MRQMLTLVKRELIEHRSSWVVTTVFGGLFVLAALLAVFGLVRVGVFGEPMNVVEFADSPERFQLREGLHLGLLPIAAVLNMVMTFVVIFYFLDALYTERKDRSILFWKSLPVSDLKVVASKYLTGIVAIPLVTVVVFLATVVLVVLITGIGLWFAGGVGDVLAGGPGAIVQATLMLMYALAVQALWFAPIDGWLLLVSAFAKRAVLAWAVVPPALAVAAERLLFGTRHFLDALVYRIRGVWELAFDGRRQNVIVYHGDEVLESLPQFADLLTPGRLFASPSLWLGIVVGVLLLACAVWLRRWRDEA